MKKETEKKTKPTEFLETFLPDRVKDDPNENLKKEKKLYSIIFIVVSALILVANLIAMIINFCVSLAGGFTSLFVGFINCAISIALLGLLIVIAHNISKTTRATLFICSKLMRDEKRLLAEKKAEQSVEQAEDEEKEEVAVADDEEAKQSASVEDKKPVAEKKQVVYNEPEPLPVNENELA